MDMWLLNNSSVSSFSCNLNKRSLFLQEPSKVIIWRMIFEKERKSVSWRLGGGWEFPLGLLVSDRMCGLLVTNIPVLGGGPSQD